MKIFRLAAIFMLLGFLSINAYSNPAVTPAASNIAASNQQVGIAAAVTGKVELSRGKQVGRIVESGDPIYLGDEIKTDESGTLQVILLDETVFTVGRNSTLIIENFNFDPKTNEGEVEAEIVDGVFKMVTGKIAKKKPEKMKVQLPVGIMGVRGTMTLLRANRATKTSTAVLTGPGRNHNTQHRTGSIEMFNDDSSGQTQSQVVDTPGFASTVEPGKAPTFFRAPDSLIQDLTNAVAPTTDEGDDDGAGGGSDSSKKDGGDGGDDDGSNDDQGSDDAGGVDDQGDDAGDEGGGDLLFGDDGDSMSEQAGQDIADGGEGALDFFDLGEFGDDFGDDAIDSAQDAADDLFEFEDGITQIEELLSFDMGVIQYNKQNIPFDGMGNFDAHFDIDLGQKKFLGDITGSSATIDGGNSFQFIFNESYAGSSGDAFFSFSAIPSTSGPCASCTADLDVTAFNANGLVADELDFDLTVKEGSNTETASDTLFSSV